MTSFSGDKKVMVYQLGTNNWQASDENGNVIEYAPGSGILHESFHNSMNGDLNIPCYSIYPSNKQTSHKDPRVKIFTLDHPIPICESVSPVSNFRWHSMSADQLDAYAKRLEDAVYEQMKEAEEREGTCFNLVIAHHSFLNPIVMQRVLARRQKEGKPKCLFAAFAHGTALKMFAAERRGHLGQNPDEAKEFPYRFLPMMEASKVFSSPEEGGVQIVYAISNEQVEKFLDIFPSFPKDRVVVSPNGVNQRTFQVVEGASIPNTLSKFSTVPYAGSQRTPEKLNGSKYDHLVVFVGKFADWKRVPSLLYAAKEYEAQFDGKLATVIVGTGPLEAQKELQDLALEDLQLKHTFFLGPKPQPILAELFTAASVACFPSYQEPFGMVFVEAMACGTPVIGAASGGPLDFVNDSVGCLVEETGQKTTDLDVLGGRLAKAIISAIREDWKSKKSPACLKLVQEKYSVVSQIQKILDGTFDKLG